MTSATKHRITPRQTEQLLKVLQAQSPRVYAGLVRRFTPKGQQLSGLWDSITGIANTVVTGVTNFVNSQGASSLLTAATPFLQNRLERRQLELNLQRMQSGLPPQTYTPPPGTPGYMPPATSYPGVTYYPDPTQQPWPAAEPKAIPWGWIAGGAIGIGLVMSMRGR